MDGPDTGPFPNAFGRCPIVVLLGDFLQLPPTNNISVVEDLLAKDEATGQYIRRETPSLEVNTGTSSSKPSHTSSSCRALSASSRVTP